MSAAILKQDAWSNSQSASPWTQDALNAFDDGTGALVTAGNAIVIFWSSLNANPLISITDNYGNSYSKIPNASFNDTNTGYNGEFWIAYNVAGVTSGNPLEVTFDYSGSASNNVGFWALEISGINSATVVAGTKDVDITNHANFTGVSLNGGSGAVYLTGLSGIFNEATGSADTTTVGSPWSILTRLIEVGAPLVAALVSSGVQQPTFTPEPTPGDAIGVICSVAFTGVSIGPSGLPFLGSVVAVGSVPSGKTNPFLGTFKIVSAAPGGQAVGQTGNPYLGHIVVVENPPAGYNGPNPVLGEVVVIGSAPAGALDPWLGSAETE
jgi:hypothetical protein